MAPTTSAPIFYRPMAPDEAAASQLVASVFDQFIAPEYFLPMVLQLA
jgi:hypothetical protein